MKGASRCDPEQCEEGYVYNFGTQKCDGKFIIIIIIIIILFAHKIPIHIHMTIHEKDKQGYRALTVAVNTSCL